MTKTVRIGGASSFFTDSTTAVAQLLTAEPCPTYLMFDFMAEGTIGMMARAKAANPEGGYVPDFINIHIADNLHEIASRGVKLIANAGAFNPKGCAEAVQALLKERGVALKVAYVEGDNLLDRAETLRARGVRDMFTGAPFPPSVDSINAYLGGFPIAQALAAGADIVITGRCADSALGLGPLIHEFGWGPEDWDRLAAGSLVGHLLECGCQVTGGTFTDWEAVDDWVDIGYPIADVAEDGSCVLSKAPNTGGLISVGSVGEQLLYEVSDPQAYIVPDVVCDFAEVKLEQVGPNRVAVSGARGYPATDTYKAVASFHTGWRGTYTQVIIGVDAVRKAERQGSSLVERGRRLLRARNLGEFARTDVEVVGAEAAYGPRATAAPREVMMRASVDHIEKAAVDLFCRESRASTSAMAPGSTATLSDTVVAISKLLLFLVPKSEVTVTVTMDGRTSPSPQHLGQPFDPATIPRPKPPTLAEAAGDGWPEVPLIELAWGRSGDKGNLFNVGVIARKAEHLPYLRAALTPERVGDWFGHLFPPGAERRVTAFDVPGFSAINFVLHDSLDGGVLVSPRVDSCAKGMAQQLLEITVPIPQRLRA